MQLTFKAPIWYYPLPVDFRKQIDGLSLLVADQLSLNPLSGEGFLFRNRHANKVKLLWYDGNGFWLGYKRLEKGRLKFPRANESVMALDHDQLTWLLSGLDIEQLTVLPKCEASRLF